MKIILASKSEARKQLLKDLGLKFVVMPSDLDESIVKDKIPSVLVKKLARFKAEVVFNRLSHEGNGENKGNEGKNEDVVIIAADTLVYLPATPGVDGYKPMGLMIGKPKDKKDAKSMLQKLSSSTHWLYTGICVRYVRRAYQRDTQPQGLNVLDYDKTKVVFRKITDKEIDEYVQNPEVLKHAGGYTIEKSTMGEGFIKKIEGSYSNVLGLPVEKLKKILKF